MGIIQSLIPRQISVRSLRNCVKTDLQTYGCLSRVLYFGGAGLRRLYHERKFDVKKFFHAKHHRMTAGVVFFSATGMAYRCLPARQYRDCDNDTD